MKEKGPNVAIRAGLKTAGFPQLRTSLCVQQPSGLSLCGQYLFVHKLIYSPLRLWDIVCKKLERSVNLSRAFSATPF